MPARAILPSSALAPSRQLPFLYFGTIRHQNGTTLAANVPVSVWPVGGRTDEVGRAYDHAGECPYTYADALEEENTRLYVNGRRYIIVDAVPHPFLPHVALILREARGA